MLGKGYRLFSIVVALTSFFLVVVSGRSEKGGVSIPPVKISRLVYFHGKGEEPEVVRKDCSSQAGCHLVFPHEDRRGFAAFRNQHETFMDCFVCHRISGFEKFAVEKTYGRRVVILETLPQRGDFHAQFMKPVGCDGCHTDEGKRRFEKVTGEKFGSEMVNPLPLILLKEGSKKWFVPGF